MVNQLRDEVVYRRGRMKAVPKHVFVRAGIHCAGVGVVGGTDAIRKAERGWVVDELRDHLIWRFDAPSVIPYAGDHNTPGQVREGFFRPLANTQKDYALATDEFIAQDDKVIMVGSYGATVIATGKRFDLPLVHVWTIQDSQVKRFVNFTDTAKAADAYTKT